MGVLLYAVFIGSVNLKCLFLKHAQVQILMQIDESSSSDGGAF